MYTAWYHQVCFVCRRRVRVVVGCLMNLADSWLCVDAKGTNLSWAEDRVDMAMALRPRANYVWVVFDVWIRSDTICFNYLRCVYNFELTQRRMRNTQLTALGFPLNDCSAVSFRFLRHRKKSTPELKTRILSSSRFFYFTISSKKINLLLIRLTT